MAHNKEKESEEPKGESDVLEHLFGSKTRVRLLRLFLDKPERAYFVREITRRVESQLNSVRREVENMVSLGLLKETVSPVDLSTISSSVRGASSKKRYYQANQDFVFFEELQNIVRKSSMLLHDLLLQKLQELGAIELLVFTGKMMEAPVQTDVLIVSDMKSDIVREAIASFEHELGREVNYTHMPIEEYRYRKEVRDRFLESIFQNKHMVVYSNIDLKK